MKRDIVWILIILGIVFALLAFALYGNSAENMVIELNETILDRNETIQGQVDQLNLKDDRILDLEEALFMSLSERQQWVVMDYHNDLEECENALRGS